MLSPLSCLAFCHDSHARFVSFDSCNAARTDRIHRNMLDWRNIVRGIINLKLLS